MEETKWRCVMPCIRPNTNLIICYVLTASEWNNIKQKIQLTSMENALVYVKVKFIFVLNMLLQFSVPKPDADN